MDMQFWAARVYSSNHISSAVQSAATRNNNSDEIGADKVRAWFPCPFCYVEIELQLLCVHLQEEHCFNLKNAVCPICAANLGKDPLEHFTNQHAHSIKRRKKSHKLLSNPTADIVRDFRELSSFLGANNDSLIGRGSGHKNEPAFDPLLSPFVSSMPHLDACKENLKDVSSCSVAATCEKEKALLDDVEEHDFEEKKQRAKFLQELLLSTIF